MVAMTPPSSRAVAGPARLLRGGAGAVVMTALAAASHSAAVGGPLPPLALMAFAAVLAAPVTTALAGRTLSLWRTLLAVLAAQGIFHALYAVAGGAHAVHVAAGVDPAHVGHLAADSGPALTVSATAAAGDGHGAGMLGAHVAAALLTAAVLRHGERVLAAAAEQALAAVPALRLLAFLLTGPVVTPRPLRLPAMRVLRPVGPLLVLGTPGRRGPPALVLAA
ncbi:hypothetical protein [Micrococcus sp.]|uniref:hypothetical protein n=1 Tax=Micrococcus sp. TaxID=1271 RepID=UPI002A9139B7|nr:hypothetical protein [Micrococcus sp.]MDY6054882.1 hypothetical protein [Micrococcus sp.]